jgi:acetoacetate decarboxylase
MKDQLKLDPGKIYQMPLIMGPQFDKEQLPGLKYPHIENIAIQYKTDSEAAMKLIPECYELDPAVLVTVFFGYYNGLDFLAGGAYNVATCQIAARFDGHKDHVEGDYMAVMFENVTMPILGGREYLGVPKLYADIPPLKIMREGQLRCEASLWGHLLFGIELPPLKKQNNIVKNIASKRINSRPWLAYKYSPSLDGPPDADYPTITRNDVKINDLWMGKKGSIYFGSAGVNDIGPVLPVMEALKTLKVVRIEQVLHFQGSAVLRFDQSRRLG